MAGWELRKNMISWDFEYFHVRLGITKTYDFMGFLIFSCQAGNYEKIGFHWIFNIFMAGWELRKNRISWDFEYFHIRLGITKKYDFMGFLIFSWQAGNYEKI